MPDYTKSVAVLNEARSMELFGIDQYMSMHYILADADYGDLATKMKLIAKDEMKHAEKFAERITELNSGVPTTRRSEQAKDFPVSSSADVVAIYTRSNEIEIDTLAKYAKFAKTCRDAGDNISALLFEKIMEEEQVHKTYFEDTESHATQLDEKFLAEVVESEYEEDDITGFVDKLDSRSV